MAQAARKIIQANTIQFPSTDVSEITLNTAQLESIIQRAVESATAKSAPSYQTTDSLYKSNGIRKASPSQPLRTSDEYKKICHYLLIHGRKEFRARNYLLVALGCSLGLRISDLLKLTVNMCFDNEGQVRNRISIVEKKTRKKNNYVIITSIGREALEMWKDTYGLTQYEYIFFSQKGGHITRDCAYKAIKDATSKIGLQGTYGTHMMRKTFGYQAFTAAQKIGMEGQALELLQTKYNHSDQRVTMKYACIADNMIAEMAEAASRQLEGDNNEI